MSNIWKREFDGLFSVSEVKRIFKKDNKTIQPFDIEKQINEYDLRNQNTYDLETKELISIGKQWEYNTVFVLALRHIYVLDVFPFLNHHYQNTSDKTEFIQYLEYSALTQVKSEGVKNAIKGWLNEIKTLPISQDKLCKLITHKESENIVDENIMTDFCRTMLLSIPREHFEIFTTAKSKNGKPYLTKKQFDNFIDKAFSDNKDLEKIKMNQASGELGKIIHVFRQFYDNYVFDYGLKLDEVIKLLSDNFKGWKFKKIKDRINKPPKFTM